MPDKNDDPGGCTIRSAPMPTVRFLASFSIPSDRPTITRISVTSTAIATMLINDRTGRCNRFAKIILFIGLSVAVWRLAIGSQLSAFSF